MGYYGQLLVVFGIPLTESQFRELTMEFYPEIFKNVGTGVDPEGEEWNNETVGRDIKSSKFAFKNREEETDCIMFNHSISGCYMEEQDNTLIPNTTYHLISIDNCDKWQGAYLALHVHSHQISSSQDNPKQMFVPYESDIYTFMQFAKPYLKKYNIESEYSVMTLIQGG